MLQVLVGGVKLSVGSFFVLLGLTRFDILWLDSDLVRVKSLDRWLRQRLAIIVCVLLGLVSKESNVFDLTIIIFVLVLVTSIFFVLIIGLKIKGSVLNILFSYLFVRHRVLRRQEFMSFSLSFSR